MNFGAALLLLKSGAHLTREGWNGKGMYIYIHVTNELEHCNYIAMLTASGNVVPWTASQTDLLADDWLCGLEEID